MWSRSQSSAGRHWILQAVDHSQPTAEFIDEMKLSAMKLPDADLMKFKNEVEAVRAICGLELARRRGLGPGKIFTVPWR